MFSSLKVKLQSLLRRRSASTCVQSKVKRINSKKDKSLKKIPVSVPEDMDDMCSTPKKYHSIEISNDQFDYFETAVKDAGTISNSLLANNICYANNERPWLNNFSEAEQSGYSELLLPNSQDMKTVSRKKIQSKTQRAQNENIYESQKIIQNFQHQISVQIRSDQATCQTLDTGKENSLIDLLIQNPSDEQKEAKPSIKSIKRDRALSIKQERLESYEKVKQIELKRRSNISCMICQEKASSNDSFHLACTHKIHRLCAEIARWKPRMKCMLCERKNVADVGFHLIKGEVVKKDKQK